MRLKALLPVGIGGGIALIAVLLQAMGVFSVWSERNTDRFFLDRTADPRITVVAIDDASLGRIGRWPWPRTVHADLVRALDVAGAKVIAYDVNFPEPSDAASDDAFARAMREAGNVVLPIELPLRASKSGIATFATEGIVRSIPSISAAAKATGHTNTPLDPDQIVRRFPPMTQGEDRSTVRAFSVEVAALAFGEQGLPPFPTDDRGMMRIHVPNAPRVAFRTVSAADVLQGKADAALLRDAIVFVGATARDLHDAYSVPTSVGEPMPGVEIHASAFDTIAGQHWLVPLSPALYVALLILTGLLLGLLVPFMKARWSLVLAVALFVGWIVGAFIAFDRGILIDIVWPTLVIAIGYLALIIERWVEADQRRREIKNAFSRYVSSNVVDALLKNPAKLKLGGERRHMTVLFSDLRGFTTLSEGLTPEKLVEVLNRYLHEMTNIVFEEGGVLDKYIGDAVMAFWNAPFDQPDHGVRAVRAAVKMRLKLAEMNKTGAFPPGITLKVGVGLNTGDMVVGNIGGELRFDYTVIGDSVNLASRTEGLCKEYGSEIIVTEATKQAMGDGFVVRKLDKVAVKGKKEPIQIYQVFGVVGSVSDAELGLIKAYEEALNAYFAQQFEQAEARCAQLLATYPEDVATKNLQARCETYRTCPPLQDWDGTWVMTKK